MQNCIKLFTVIIKTHYQKVMSPIQIFRLVDKDAGMHVLNKLLTDLKGTCMYYKIPLEYWKWIINRLDEMNINLEVYSD